MVSVAQQKHKVAATTEMKNRGITIAQRRRMATMGNSIVLSMVDACSNAEWIDEFKEIRSTFVSLKIIARKITQALHDICIHYSKKELSQISEESSLSCTL